MNVAWWPVWAKLALAAVAASAAAAGALALGAGGLLSSPSERDDSVPTAVLTAAPPPAAPVSPSPSPRYPDPEPEESDGARDVALRRVRAAVQQRAVLGVRDCTAPCDELVDELDAEARAIAPSVADELGVVLADDDLDGIAASVVAAEIEARERARDG